MLFLLSCLWIASKAVCDPDAVKASNRITPSQDRLRGEAKVVASEPAFLSLGHEPCPDEFYGLQCETHIADFPYAQGGWPKIDEMLGFLKGEDYRGRQRVAAEWLSEAEVTTVLDMGPYGSPIANFLDTSQSQVRDVIEVDPTTKKSDIEVSPTRPKAHLVRAGFDDVFLKNGGVVNFEKIDHASSALVFLGIAGCYGDADSDGNTMRATLSAVIPKFSTIILESPLDPTNDDNSKKCFDYVMSMCEDHYEVQKDENLTMDGGMHPHRHMVMLKKKS